MDSSTLENLIVREIRKAKVISRRDLAENLEVSRSTAGRRVDSLIERGLLRESGLEEKSEVGRPKRFLGLCGEFGCFAGFDFDARHVYSVLTNFSQQQISSKKVNLSSTPTRREVVTILKKIIEGFHAETGTGRLLSYGIGVPGRVHQESGIAMSYPYIENWENVNLAEELNLPEDRLHVENNTKTIALCEYWLGQDAPPEHLVCISIRTGISAAIISDGHLLRGHHEMAGEIRGWEIARRGGSQWLEDCATVKAILSGGVFSKWSDYVKACQANDHEAMAILDQIIQFHSDTVSRIVQLSDPEVVFISGAFNELGDIYLERLRSSTASVLSRHYFDSPIIRFVSRGEFAGALGAAALTAKHYKPTL